MNGFIHNTSDIKFVDCFHPTNTPIAEHQLGVLQFNSDLTLTTAVKADPKG